MAARVDGPPSPPPIKSLYGGNVVEEFTRLGSEYFPAFDIEAPSAQSVAQAYMVRTKKIRS